MLTDERRQQIRAEGRAHFDHFVARLQASGKARIYQSYGPVLDVDVLSIDPYDEAIGGATGWYGAEVRLPSGRKDRFPLSMLYPVGA